LAVLEQGTLRVEDAGGFGACVTILQRLPDRLSCWAANMHQGKPPLLGLMPLWEWRLSVAQKYEGPSENRH